MIESLHLEFNTIEVGLLAENYYFNAILEVNGVVGSLRNKSDDESLEVKLEITRNNDDYLGDLSHSCLVDR